MTPLHNPHQEETKRRTLLKMGKKKGGGLEGLMLARGGKGGRSSI